MHKNRARHFVALSGGTTFPNQISGLTGWWDAGDPTTLYTDAGSTNVIADGNAVYRMADKSGGAGNRYFDQSTEGFRPLYKTSRQNGRSGLLFDGTDDNIVSIALSNFIANDAYTLFVVAKPITVATNEVNIYNNDAIISDSSGYFGAHLKSAPTIHGYNYDTDPDFTSHSITANTAYLLTTYHSGGTLYSHLNNGAAQSSASGNTGLLTGLLRIGLGLGGAFANIDFYEAALYNVVLSASNRGAINAYLMSKWGL